MDVDDLENEKKFFKSKNNLKFLLCLDESINLTNRMEEESDLELEEGKINIFDMMIDEPVVEYKYTKEHNYD